MSDYTLDELCVIACADAFRGDGEILASPVGIVPMLGVRIAKSTFSPELVMTDGVASLVANVLPLGASDASRVVEGWMPYRSIFDVVWSGRRHVMMGASQIDRFGNQNIACIGDWNRPKSQLIGVRGAPGNTICHKTSYWIPNHTPKTFVSKVDFVSGVGYDRARALPEASRRYHHIARVVTNLGVFDFESEDNAMRIRSLHRGVALEDVAKQTGFSLVVPATVPETRSPTEHELRLLRDVLDPSALRKRELRA